MNKSPFGFSTASCLRFWIRQLATGTAIVAPFVLAMILQESLVEGHPDRGVVQRGLKILWGEMKVADIPSAFGFRLPPLWEAYVAIRESKKPDLVLG